MTGRAIIPLWRLFFLYRLPYLLCCTTIAITITITKTTTAFHILPRFARSVAIASAKARTFTPLLLRSPVIVSSASRNEHWSSRNSKISTMEPSERNGSVLSAQELRFKRLQALGDSTATNAPAAAATVDVENGKPRAAVQHPPKKVAAESVDVIDLCGDSSEDDDDSPPSPKRAAAAKKHRRRLSESSTDDDNDDDSVLRVVPKAAPTGRPAKQSKLGTATTTTAVSSTAVTVATYNVWFGPAGDGAPHPGPRMSAVCRALLSSPSQQQPPAFVGFQEVVPALWHALQTPLQAAGYELYQQRGVSYGCAVAVQVRGPGAVTVLDAGWKDYRDTVMMRGFWYVRARLPGREEQVLFTTTHLESWTGKDSTGQVQRALQVQELEQFCNEQLETYSNLQSVIITGDLNWDDERVRGNGNDDVLSTVLQTEWQDAWLETKQGPKDACYTYDGKMNPMLGNSLRRRFDRVLTRSSNTQSSFLSPVATQLVGTQAIPNLTFQKHNPYKRTSRECAVAPSDHFGLVVKLRMNT